MAKDPIDHRDLDKRKIYLHALDEVLAGRTPDPKRRRKNAIHRMPLAEDVLLSQLRQSRKLCLAIDRLILRSLRADDEWVPPPEIIKASLDTALSIKSTLHELRAVQKHAKAAMDGLTPEQLDEVFMHNLLRTSNKLTEEHWRRLLTARFGEDVAERLVSAEYFAKPAGYGSTVCARNELGHLLPRAPEPGEVEPSE